MLLGTGFQSPEFGEALASRTAEGGVLSPAWSFNPLSSGKPSRVRARLGGKSKLLFQSPEFGEALASLAGGDEGGGNEVSIS